MQNSATKDEENAEVLNYFFASICNSKRSCPSGAQCSELKGRDGNRMKPQKLVLLLLLMNF